MVDDASTDESVRILEEIAADNPSVRIVRHERNEGQLAAFETAMAQSGGGDIVFLLDADDVYSPHYLATVVKVYEDSPRCDFLYCGYRHFTDRPSFVMETAEKPQVNDLGLSIVRTMARRAYLGTPTSCLSIRRRVADDILPLPRPLWRTGIDDWLIFGASLAGARKFQLDAPIVGYRLHGANDSRNPAWSDPQVYLLKLIAKDRLIDFFVRKYGLQAGILGLAHSEFKTIPKPRFRTFLEYSGYVLRNGARGVGRPHGLATMAKWYMRSKLRRRATQE